MIISTYIVGYLDYVYERILIYNESERINQAYNLKLTIQIQVASNMQLFIDNHFYFKII